MWPITFMLAVMSFCDFFLYGLITDGNRKPVYKAPNNLSNIFWTVV